MHGQAVAVLDSPGPLSAFVWGVVWVVAGIVWYTAGAGWDDRFKAWFRGISVDQAVRGRRVGGVVFVLMGVVLIVISALEYFGILTE